MIPDALRVRASRQVSRALITHLRMHGHAAMREPPPRALMAADYSLGE